jgi:hypothetical protein
MVAIAGPVNTPQVIRQWRVELADRGITGSMQPYHAAERMALEDAEKYLERCSDATADMARRAVQDTLAELSDYQVKGTCVLLASGRPLPAMARILASHALIHTAEGEFYRAALCHALEFCGLPVLGIKERELVAEAALALGRSVEDLQSTVAAFGKIAGPPWRQDEKLSALAAWLALSRRA